MGRVKAVFTDRDGTINVDKGYVHRIEDFEFIPGSIEGLRLLTRHGIKIYIVSNQAGIAKGYYGEEDYRRLTDFMVGELRKEGVELEGALYCPHHPEGVVPEYSIRCGCRKPGTGLIAPVLERERLGPDEAVLIGDKETDIEAGVNLGMATYLVLTGYGEEYRMKTKATYVMKNLHEAVHHLLKS